MKLHYHPISTTCRTIMLFAAENAIPLEMKVVDLFTGEHMQPTYAGLNPNRLIPTLEDGDFVLTENSAILKYLADKAGSPAYPKDLQKRARVNERMDWTGTQLCSDLVYGLVSFGWTFFFLFVFARSIVRGLVHVAQLALR